MSLSRANVLQVLFLACLASLSRHSVVAKPFSLMRALQQQLNSASYRRTPASGLGSMALELSGRDFGWTESSKFYFLNTFSHVSEIMQHVSPGSDVQSLTFPDVEAIIESRRNAGKVNPGVLFPPKCLFAFDADAAYPSATSAMQLVRDVQSFGLTDECFWYVLVDGLVFLEPTYHHHKPQVKEESFPRGASPVGRFLRSRNRQ